MSNTHLAFSYDQIWTLIIGALTPLISYALNRKLLSHLSQAVKAAIHIIVAAIAGAMYTAIGTHVFGFNGSTLQLVITAVIGSLGAHNLLWKPAGVSNAVETLYQELLVPAKMSTPVVSHTTRIPPTV